MLEAFKDNRSEVPKINRKTEKLSLFDVQDDLTFMVHLQSASGDRSAVPFEMTLLADNLVKLRMDSSVFADSRKDVVARVALNRRASATTLKSDRKRGGVRNEAVPLSSQVEICVTCFANKGV